MIPLLLLLALPARGQAWTADLETGDGGLVAGGDTDQWAWGTPGVEPWGGHEGSRCWGTVLDGFYLNDAEDWLRLPDVDLTGLVRPVLSGWHWFDVERGDGGWVETDSGDGWAVRAPIYGYPTTDGFSGSSVGWTPFWVDLEGLDSANRVRFVFRSDPVAAGLGWYIDDLAISDGDVVPPRVLSTTCPEDTDDIEGPYTVEAVVRDDAGVEQAWVYWRVGSGSAVKSAMSWRGGDRYEGPVAGQDPDSTITAWVAATDGVNRTDATDLACTFRVRLPAPVDLSGPEDRIWGATVPLTWSAPESRHAVEGYRVYRDGVAVLDTVKASADAPLVTGVQAFTVTALYDVGEGDASDPWQVEAAVPRIDALDPDQGYQGDRLRVRLQGEALLLVQDEVGVDLGDGVTVESIDVRDVDVAFLTLAIARRAEPGPRDLSLETGGVQVGAAEAFEVLGGADRPRLISVDPESLEQGEGDILVIRASQPFPSVPEVTIGEEIVVESVEVAATDLLLVEVAVPFDAALGAHPIEVDDGTRILAGLDLTVQARITEAGDGCPGCRAGPGGRGAYGPLLALLVALGLRRRSGAVQAAAVHGDALPAHERGGR